MTTQCAVLGSPIAHSLSPVLHRAAYAELGLDWEYRAIEMTSARLPRFLDERDASWRGLSLTMPLKRSVVTLVDELDPWARISGAANTVLFGEGRRTGHNTDIPGAVAAMREREVPEPETAVVLGGGATAASLLLALSDLGCRRTRLLVRDPERAAETLAAADRVGLSVELGSLTDPIGPVDLLASTIPAEAQTPAMAEAAAEAASLFEVIYDPWPTPLAAAALSGDAVVVTGLDLLIHQATLQVTLMTDRVAPLEAMRAAGETALAERVAGRGEER